MYETIYPTWAKQGNHWVKNMLEDWRKSGKPYLCFPWILFYPHKLPASPFWMYFYYAQGLTDIPHLQGKFEYRVRVVSWQPDKKYVRDDILLVRANEDGKAWFLCDRFEVTVKENGGLLTLHDFNHFQGKNLISSLRNSIPQVVRSPRIKVLQYYP